MKRKIALLMAAMMTVSLIGCSNQNSATESQQSADQQDSAMQSEDTSAPEQEEQSDGEWNFEGVTLNIAHATTGEVGEAFTAQFNAFEELTGAKIEVEMLSADPDEQVSILNFKRDI